MRIFMKQILKQSRSYGPNSVYLVGFVGVPPLSKESSDFAGRVQSNLKLGGNTDLKVRPKLINIST